MNIENFAAFHMVFVHFQCLHFTLFSGRCDFSCIRPWAKYFYLDTTSYLAVFTISQNQRLLVLVSAFPPHVRKLTVGNLILPTGEYIHIPPRIYTSARTDRWCTFALLQKKGQICPHFSTCSRCPFALIV